MTNQDVRHCCLKITLLFCFAFCSFCVPKAQAALYCEADNGFRYMTVSECEALMQIFYATDGPNWQTSSGSNTPWNENGPHCDGDSGTVRCSGPLGEQHVIELNLKAVGMNGVLPGSAFANLPYLQQIDLSHNSLKGPIPSEITELAVLRTLDLGFNLLTGVIPEDLLGPGEPSPLTRLYLANNNFSGSLPQSLGRNDVRSIMVLQNPNLGGPIPHSYIYQSQMVSFRYWGTQICEPQDQSMQNWLDGLTNHTGTNVPCIDAPPLTPGTITATDGTSPHMVVVQWGASTGAVSYELERATGESGSTWTQLSTSTGLNYQDTTAVPGAPYRYRVRGCNSSSNCSAYSNIDSGYRALSPPTSLTIKKENPIPVGNTYIYDFHLEWAPVANAEFYRLYSSFNYFSKYEGNESSFYLETTTTQTSIQPVTGFIEPTYAIVACNAFTCSKAAMVQAKSPPITPAIDLLLKDFDSLLNE